MSAIKNQIKEIISKYLLNSKGFIEGQRLQEKWFHNKNLSMEYELLKTHNILDVKSIYMFLNDDNGLCICSEPKRFVNMKEGFKEYCEKCSRILNNTMKSQGNTDIEIELIPNYIQDKNGNYNSSKIKSLSQNTINKIIERTNYLPDKSEIGERIYNIEHNIFDLPICRECSKPHNNFYFKEGYAEYCKGLCTSKNTKKAESTKQAEYFYNKYIEKFKSSEEYIIKIFSFEDYLNGNCTIEFEHVKCSHKYTLDVKYQGHTKCPKCFPVRSKKQYEIYEWLNSYTSCKMNDRQFLKPLELDILTPKFAIEYDSLAFHSYGISSQEKFNDINENKNEHLNKTELCESKGIQLFRIFSNEWINSEDKWKSVILSQLNLTKRIFARKCYIKEISSEDARLFFEDNHLQGYVNSSMRIGLFSDDILVSAMTFGKPRSKKWNSEGTFELLRFASLLNHTIIGGASKILKYFEINFKPQRIISYANRRWSIGNLYYKMGFEFVENTTPNYFYFKGSDSSKLFSREQFQKHKLKDKLEIFDENLSETQNMFNNCYRKIYDCGNMVFCKIYKEN